MPVSQQSSPVSIYIHIPFCEYICTYCAFNTYLADDLVTPYVEALVHEIESIALSKPGLAIHTVFFGGGTPGMLSLEQLAQIQTALRQAFDLDDVHEVTLETNPENVTLEYAAGLRELGIDRLSIGMQSAIQRELELYGRGHLPDAAMRAVDNARSAGFQNISLDVIFGTPGQSIDDWRHTLDFAVKLAPENVSLYGLELHGGTPLTGAVRAGKMTLPDDEVTASMYELAGDALKAAGFEQYEISNWSQPGYESQHNIQYWRNLPYLGIGAGAHGYAAGKRTIVKRAPSRYVDSFKDDSPIFAFPQTPATSKISAVSREDEISETIMMGMRMTHEGIDRARFAARFGEDIYAIKRSAIDKHLKNGLLELTDTTLRLTEQGRLISNFVLVDLI